MSFRLSDDDRSRILEFLKTAPDIILLEAAHNLKAEYVRSQETFEQVRKFMSLRSAVLVNAPEGASIETEPEPTPAPSPKAKSHVAKGTEPPGTAAGRIGSKNRDAILGCLRRGPNDLEGISRHIKVGKNYLPPLLKLLWSRGEIKFDGTVFSI